MIQTVTTHTHNRKRSTAGSAQQTRQHGRTTEGPPGNPLKPEQIAALTEWVKIGAPWPSGAPKVENGPLWSVRPIVRSNLPKVTNPLWVRNPIDAFVLAKLDAKGMKPAPSAGRR